MRKMSTPYTCPRFPYDYIREYSDFLTFDDLKKKKKKKKKKKQFCAEIFPLVFATFGLFTM